MYANEGGYYTNGYHDIRSVVECDELFGEGKLSKNKNDARPVGEELATCKDNNTRRKQVKTGHLEAKMKKRVRGRC